MDDEREQLIDDLMRKQGMTRQAAEALLTGEPPRRRISWPTRAYNNPGRPREGRYETPSTGRTSKGRPPADVRDGTDGA